MTDAVGTALLLYTKAASLLDRTCPVIDDLEAALKSGKEATRILQAAIALTEAGIRIVSEEAISGPLLEQMEN